MRGSTVGNDISVLPVDFAEGRDVGSGDVQITGVSAPLETWTERMIGLQVRFGDDAYNRTVNDGTDYRAFEGHNPSNLLGRKSAKTADSWVQGDNLQYWTNIGDPELSPRAKEIDYRVTRGDLNSVSVGIGLYREALVDDDEFDKAVEVVKGRDGTYWVTYKEVKLREYSLVSIAQYDRETSVVKLDGESFEAEEPEMSDVLLAQRQELVVVQTGEYLRYMNKERARRKLAQYGYAR